MENSLQPLAELSVELRHLLRQIGQGTTALYIPWPMWQPLHNADQGINGIGALAPLQGERPPLTGEFCNDLFDNGVSKSLLALEMVVERSLGNVRGGQNRIDSGALEAVFVNLPERRLQQVLARAPGIARSFLPVLLVPGS